MVESHQYDLNRVKFYSTDNLANGMYLSRAETILRDEMQSAHFHENINDVMELYNIKQYIDNGVYLKSWTQDDIDSFKKKAIEYGRIVGQFMSKINDSNIIPYFEKLLKEYINSFWELLNNQKIYKQVSTENFATILSREPHEIYNILTYKNLVDYYKTALRDFLLNDHRSAEILLSVYEAKQEFDNKEKFFPNHLTIQDKEDIISKYIDRENANLNYLKLIQNVRDKNDFKISAKTRLKAKRVETKTMNTLSEENKQVYFNYGVSVSFPENAGNIKQESHDHLVVDYSYSLSYIKQNSDNYSLFCHFTELFEYLDEQGRINLVVKRNQMGVLEKVLSIHSQNEYRGGFTFNLSDMTSYAQIVTYNKIIINLGNTIENILQLVFTSIFQEKYYFASNTRLIMPVANSSCFEKVRLLAPEFESVLKQYKLFVEDGSIDFELLQINSVPCTIREIPSLNADKYLYFNGDNQEMVGCSNLLFSDQTLLGYVEPFEEKHYPCLFDLLANEQVNYNNYEEYRKPKINYLINKGFLSLDENNFIQIVNPIRVRILKDLYDNEVASFHHYPLLFQKEAKEMAIQNMIFFESSLFSKPEQSYFNYFLNKSEFTNGLDLRNSYLHGTQAGPEDLQKHEYVYFTYLKLLILALLKIDNDLFISKRINEKGRV